MWENWLQQLRVYISICSKKFEYNNLDAKMKIQSERITGNIIVTIFIHPTVDFNS